VGKHAILASNTSGLSITKLSEALPEHQAALLRHPLLQPAALHAPGGADRHPHHRARVLDQLEAFVTSGLGKGVVRAKDTPNFIANRIGIAGMLATMKEVRTSA
jgi:3-hydroxyacyl-CoA dehydrogenase